MKNNWKKWLSRAGTLFFITFAVLVFWRMYVLEKQSQTDAQVAIIHATKLTLDDVMGKNLPPKPANPDATIQGVDANKNGIRDDVELAIFQAYPDSAKTRAVLLQYALALQMEVTQQIVNQDTVIAVVQEEDRASLCLGEIYSRDNLNQFIKQTDTLSLMVDSLQLNTEARKSAQKSFFKKLGSYASLDRYCDIDYSKLSS